MKSALAVVMVHGMDGTDFDFKIFKEQLMQNFETLVPRCTQKDIPLYLMVSNVNAGPRTRDGIAMVSSRLVEEVCEWMESVLQDLKDTRLHFSIVGHSAGGLFSRHALKSLLVESDEAKGRLYTLLERYPTVELIPTTFLTASSPHLGARRPAGLDFVTKLMASSGSFAKYIFGNSGKDLFLADAETLAAEAEAPTKSEDMRLLARMAQGDYLEALKQFKFKCLAGVVRNDIVQYTSACITSQNPYAQPLSFRTNDTRCRLLAYSGFHSENLSLDEIEGDKLHQFYTQTLFNHSTVGEWTMEERKPVGCRHHAGEPFPTSSTLMDTLNRSKVEKLDLPVVEEKEEEVLEFPKLDELKIAPTDTLHKKTVSTPITPTSPLMRSNSIGIRRLFAKRDDGPLKRTMSFDQLESPQTPTLERSTSTKSSKSTKFKKSHSKSKSVGSESMKRQLETMTPSDWCIDGPHSLEFSKKMMSDLQQISFRRLAIRLDMSNPMYWVVTHPLVIGKPLPLIPGLVQDVGTNSADLLAKMLVIDFLATLEEWDWIENLSQIE